MKEGRRIRRESERIKRERGWNGRNLKEDGIGKIKGGIGR